MVFHLWFFFTPSDVDAIETKKKEGKYALDRAHPSACVKNKEFSKSMAESRTISSANRSNSITEAQKWRYLQTVPPRRGQNQIKLRILKAVVKSATSFSSFSHSKRQQQQEDEDEEENGAPLSPTNPTPAYAYTYDS
ncbi:hypothetical protein PIB30_013354 [Stylosanthes scabra]|uniref:Uncharacterized protein n=1 Tax=Stylosanthes scabra TaxID=79078 RepID=A0ABU6V4P5_9FABA|nr:hypothetical protein [Stylosanthes scabra]